MTIGLHLLGVVTLFVFPHRWPFVVAVLVANHGMIALAGMWPKCRLLGPNIRRLPDSYAARGEIALTFDDGPDPEVTPEVLNILDKWGAKATFFCIGRKAEVHSNLVAEIVRRGHLVENHSHEHSNAFALMGPRTMGREVERAQTTLARCSGTTPVFFRAPAGIRNLWLNGVLASRGLHLVSWTRRGFDTVTRNPSKIAKRLARNLAGGDVILLHDTSGSRAVNGRPVVLETLPMFLEEAKSRGLRAIALPRETVTRCAATSGTDKLAPQAPEVGRIARLLGRFHVTGVFWFKFHEWAGRNVPNWAKPTIIIVFTTFFFVALLNIRRAVASNLIPVLGPCGFWERQRRIYRTMHQFAWCQTERYERLSGSDRFVIETKNREPWNELSRAAGGFILLTGHVGNWEIGAANAALQQGRQVHLVREQELDSRAQEFVRQLLRERLGDFVTTHFASGDVSLGITLLEVLREGHLVALQGDRPRAAGRTVEVTLFDRPYLLPAGPFALARAAGVPLLPVFVLRESRYRYRTEFRKPIRVSVTTDRDADVRSAAREMARAVEWAIGQQPHQWFCFRDLWGRQSPRIEGE